MNIIKLKDRVMTPEESGNTQEICDQFNDTLKGRYAWWVRCFYVVPLEDITMDQYIEYESMTEEPPLVNYLLSSILDDYIDIETTDRINSISKYVFFNSYAIGPDITIDDLRRFRTWLAEQLYAHNDFLEEYFNEDEIGNVRTMLNYYKNEMNDGVIDILGNFMSAQVVYTTFPTSGTCGCGSNGTNNGIPVSKVVMNDNLSGIVPLTLGKDCGCQQGFTLGGNTSISTCDPVAMYRNAIYNFMVKVFSDTDFWVQLSKYDPSGEKNLVEWFKRYVDGIIQQNFPLTTKQPLQFDDCQCLNTDSTSQTRAMDMLRALSTALGYIIEDSANETYEYSAGDVTVSTALSGHKNFIATALNNWATYLYEIMRW